MWLLKTMPWRSAHCSAPCWSPSQSSTKCCGSSAAHSGSPSGPHPEVINADHAVRRHQPPQRPSQVGGVHHSCRPPGPHRRGGSGRPHAPLTKQPGWVTRSQRLDLLFELVLHNSLPIVRGDRHARTGGSECRRPSRGCRAAATAPTPRPSSCRRLSGRCLDRNHASSNPFPFQFQRRRDASYSPHVLGGSGCRSRCHQAVAGTITCTGPSCATRRGSNRVCSLRAAGRCFR